MPDSDSGKGPRFDLVKTTLRPTPHHCLTCETRMQPVVASRIEVMTVSDLDVSHTR